MTSEPRAFLALDAGAATIAASLIGRIAGRWRLIGSLALPAGADPAAVASALVDRAVAADPDLAGSIGLRVGIAREHFVEGLDREVEAAIKQSLDVYRSLGAEIVELSLPHSK